MTTWIITKHGVKVYATESKPRFDVMLAELKASDRDNAIDWTTEWKGRTS